MNQQIPELMTRQEACQYLRVSQRVFDNLTATKEILGARIGGRRLIFRRQDIDGYITRKLKQAAGS